MSLSRTFAAKLAAGLLAVTMMTPALATSYVGTVVSDAGLNLRSEANTDSNVLATLPDGAMVDVLHTSEDGAWHLVSYQNTKGYVTGDYLQVSEEKVYGQVVTGPLNVRSGPGTEYPIVDTMPSSSIMVIEDAIGGLGGWYEIDGGYVSSDYVAIVDASVAASSGKGSQIAQFALQYQGYPYVYGGSSPSGFDCSGFVRYVYGQFGYSVNRTASAQMDNGVPVSRDQLQPGDMVFFNKGNPNKRATHVGVYIGNNQFIHASTPSVGVIISDMDSAYYGTGFVGARRMG